MLLTSNWLEVHSQFYCTHCIHFNHIVSWRINWFTSSIIYCLSSFFLSSSCDVWSEDPDELPLLSFSAAIWTENGKKEINVVQWKKVQTQQSKLKVVARGWLAKYVQATFGGKKINQIMNQTVSGVFNLFQVKILLTVNNEHTIAISFDSCTFTYIWRRWVFLNNQIFFQRCK